MAVEDESNNKVIISRIQQRRGLKQDLPQPLRPGEIGFASDTRQVYIGADTDDALSNSYNKVVEYERTLGAETLTSQLVNTNLIKLQLPFKKFLRSDSVFDGTVKTFSWLPSDFRFTGAGAGNTVFNADVLNANTIVNTVTSNPFTASDIIVVRNGVELVGDSGNSDPASGYDYSFSAGNTAADLHTITFKTPPQPGDEVSICYYGNTAIINSFSLSYGGSSTLYGTSDPGPVTAAGSITPESLKLNSELVLVAPESGSGFIGLESKHITIYNYTDSPSFSNLGNLIAVRGVEIGTTVLDHDQANNTITLESTEIPSSINVVRLVNSDDGNVADFDNVTFYCSVADSTANVGKSNITIVMTDDVRGTGVDLANADFGNINVTTVMSGYSIDLSSATTKDQVVNTINSENVWLSAGDDPDTSGDNFKVFSKDFLDYYLVDDANTTVSNLRFLNASGQIASTTSEGLEIYAGTNLTVTHKLLEWLQTIVANPDNSIVDKFFYNSTNYASNSGISNWSITTDITGEELVFNSASEASSFAKIVNKLYYANNITESSLVSPKGLVNIKTNIEMLTVDAFIEEQSSAEADITYNILGSAEILPLDPSVELVRIATATRDVAIIDYSIHATDTSNVYTRVGTLHAMIHEANTSIMLNDLYTEELTGYNGNLTLEASFADGGNTIIITANTDITPTLTSPVMKYTVRGWLSN